MSIWLFVIESALKIVVSAFLFKCAASIAFDKGRFECSIRTEDKDSISRFKAYIEKYCFGFGAAVGIALVVFSLYSTRADTSRNKYMFFAGVEAQRMGVENYEEAYSNAVDAYNDVAEQYLNDNYSQREWP